MKVLQKITEVPENWQVAIRNNGGGFVNHVIYWATMCPEGGGSPTGDLLMQINRAFGSYTAFQERFTSVASKLFGSGYVWLCEDEKGDLVISSSKNQVGFDGLLKNWVWAARNLTFPQTGLPTIGRIVPATCDRYMGTCILPQTPEQESWLHSELVERGMLG